MSVQLQVAMADYQRIQTELSNTVDARSRLGAQLSENELVKKEFDSLTPTNVVYKQIGPVLVKQDQAEAKSNVDTRLIFIGSEIKRLDTQLESIQEKSEKNKNEIVQLQTALQQQGQQVPLLNNLPSVNHPA